MRWLIPLLALTIACSTTEGPEGTDTGDTPDPVTSDIYDFESRDASLGSSVAYTGQTLRMVLISDLKGHLGGMTSRLNNGEFYPNPGDAEAELEFYFEFDSSVGGDLPILMDSSLGDLAQDSYDDISSDKDLVGKLAGNDPVGQHKDWSTEFVGWQSANSPEGLVREWFATIDAQAVAWSMGDVPVDPSGAPVPAVYVTPEGQDLQQLTEKFLLGAVAFSQGVDDYLDDTEAGKGLLSDHSALDEGKSYTVLEHQWDEGFGYFGASRDYGLLTLDQIADDRGIDTNADGVIDLTSEYCFGASVNAAKRDRGAAAATDFAGEAWQGFLAGRALLASTDGDLTEAELTELKGHRDQAVLAWEKSLAATVVHYINETIVDSQAVGTDSYSFGDHAKHWSELKGFALAFQFNPRSPMSDSDFETLHALIGDAPELEADEMADYLDDLREARALIGTAYGFDSANLGDDDGANGW